MDQRLAELLEKDAIRDLVTELFVATDDKDWARVKDCFADEVLFDMTSLEDAEPVALTPSQITESWEEGLRSIQAIHHQMGNFRVQVAGQSAKAFCYGTASHYRMTLSGDNTRVFVGSYDFRLEKHRDRWRINGFKFNLKYADGNLELDTVDV